MRTIFAIALIFSSHAWISLVAAADDRPVDLTTVDLTTVDLTTVDRTLVREPAYTGQPHYALFVFGPQAKQRAWFVVDGNDVAYIDRNGNGDLTDPEDRVNLDVEATRKIRLGNPGAYIAALGTGGQEHGAAPRRLGCIAVSDAGVHLFPLGRAGHPGRPEMTPLSPPYPFTAPRSSGTEPTLNFGAEKTMRKTVRGLAPGRFLTMVRNAFLAFFELNRHSIAS